LVLDQRQGSSSGHALYGFALGQFAFYRVLATQRPLAPGVMVYLPVSTCFNAKILPLW